MMTDNIYGKKKYREFEPSRIPILKEYAENYANLDPEIKKLRYVMVEPSSDNREYAFWNDSVSQSFAIMTSSLISGDGLHITSNNNKARDLIKEFNENINVNGLSIDDYITSTWIDELVHARDYWRINIDTDLPTKVDIQRLDPKTIVILRDPGYSWTKIIQRVPYYKVYRSKKAFYRNARLTDQLRTAYAHPLRDIEIQDEPDVLLRNSFFVRPPVSAALHYIVYKRYILYFMRKYSQRLWSPLLFFLVGKPDTNFYPEDDEDMQRRIDDIATLIPNLVEFSSAALQGDVDIKEVGTQSARSSAVFVDYINMLDKQIMMSQFASMGLRDASGTELATSSTLKEMYLQFITGIRRKYKSSLENFYCKCLCKVNGINISPRDIDIEFSPLKFEPTREYMQGINVAVNSGVFKDRNEVRKASQILWDWLEELDEKENSKIPFPLIMKEETQKDKTSTSDRLREYVKS